MFIHFVSLLQFLVQRKIACRTLKKHGIPEILAIDFDGCLTDDYVLIDQNGTEFVKVSRKDGLGANRIKAMGVTIVIISTEKNLVVAKRAQKMQVEFMQDVKNKQLTLQEFASIRGTSRHKIWAVGNDINDLGLFASAGLALCPNDAADEVLAKAHVVLPIKGGAGILNFIASFLENSHQKSNSGSFQ